MSVQETTYYDRAGVKITNARAVMGGNTYPMTNITSVGMGTEPASRVVAFLLVGLGVIAGLWAAVQMYGEAMFDQPINPPIVLLVITALLIGLGLLSFRTSKDKFFVKLGAAGGEQRAYSSPDKAEIESIVAAFNEAIVKRG